MFTPAGGLERVRVYGIADWRGRALDLPPVRALAAAEDGRLALTQEGADGLAGGAGGWVDAAALRQIVINFIENALKFGPDGWLYWSRGIFNVASFETPTRTYRSGSSGVGREVGRYETGGNVNATEHVLDEFRFGVTRFRVSERRCDISL